MNLRETYERIHAALANCRLDQYVEPYEHVAEVERLRQESKPRGAVRLLLIAESHVRVSDAEFAKDGPGFLYNPAYYTPWWQSLLFC